MPNFASNVLAIAKAEIGYHEKKSNYQLNNKTTNAGSNNYNKFAAFIDENYPDFYNSKKNGYAWCDIFVDYCFLKAFGLEDTLYMLNQPKRSLGAGCRYSYSYFKAAGRVGKTPKVAAQIFFGRGSESTLYHTGIVEAFDNNYVYTIEGNSGDSVARRKYSRNSSSIYGYGYPEFDAICPANDNIIPETKIGTSREVQWTGVVTVDNLNVRTWAGIENPNIKAYPQLNKGTEVGVCGVVSDNDGADWYYVLINGVTYGFVYSDYVESSLSGGEYMPDNGIIPNGTVFSGQSVKTT